MQTDGQSVLREIEMLCHQIFIQSKEGRRLHELLVKSYIIDTPVMTFDSHAHDAIAAYREGENHMVRNLRVHAENHANRILTEKMHHEVTNERSTTTDTDAAADPFRQPAAVRFDV